MQDAVSSAPVLARGLPSTPESDMVGATMFLYQLAAADDPIFEVEAYGVFPGMGEYWRVVEAVEQYDLNGKVRHLLVAGVNTHVEKTGVTLDMSTLHSSPYHLERTDGVECMLHAEHTKHQADWMADQIQRFGIKSLTLFVSSYHLLRAYLTLLKSVLDRNLNVKFYPMPVITKAWQPIPENGMPAWEAVPGEIDRIRKYQAKGDVATFDELRSYLGAYFPSIYPVLGAKPPTA